MTFEVVEKCFGCGKVDDRGGEKALPPLSVVQKFVCLLWTPIEIHKAYNMLLRTFVNACSRRPLPSSGAILPFLVRNISSHHGARDASVDNLPRTLRLDDLRDNPGATRDVSISYFG